MARPHFISKILYFLYKYDQVKTLKECVRPVKHFIFGKGDIYAVVEQIKIARGADKTVRTVFDVGAADGDKTITFLKTFPRATVYCFEPQTESLERLKRRTKKWQQRVKTFQIALGAEEGFADFHIVAHKEASSFLPPPERNRIVETRKVKVGRLDDIVRGENLDRIDLIKIDVEGAEIDVLEGGREAFKNKIDNVFIEISPHRFFPRSTAHMISVFNFLNACGFIFVDKYEDFFFSKDKTLLKEYFGSWYTEDS